MLKPITQAMADMFTDIGQPLIGSDPNGPAISTFMKTVISSCAKRGFEEPAFAFSSDRSGVTDIKVYAMPPEAPIRRICIND